MRDFVFFLGSGLLGYTVDNSVLALLSQFIDGANLHSSSTTSSHGTELRQFTGANLAGNQT